MNKFEVNWTKIGHHNKSNKWAKNQTEQCHTLHAWKWLQNHFLWNKKVPLRFYGLDWVTDRKFSLKAVCVSLSSSLPCRFSFQLAAFNEVTIKRVSEWGGRERERDIIVACFFQSRQRHTANNGTALSTCHGSWISRAQASEQRHIFSGWKWRVAIYEIT